MEEFKINVKLLKYAHLLIRSNMMYRYEEGITTLNPLPLQYNGGINPTPIATPANEIDGILLAKYLNPSKIIRKS